MHNLAGGTICTKLDATSTYYAKYQDHASSLLMTFNFPFGQFRFLWLLLMLSRPDTQGICRNAQYCIWLFIQDHDDGPDADCYKYLQKLIETW